jgi:PhoPQ-activated pathogenicity-related protein
MRYFFKNRRTIIVAALLMLAWISTIGIYAQVDPSPKELDAYIHNGDNSFRWEITDNSRDDAGIHCVVNMTSQTWHDIVWKHTMYMIEPAKLTNPDHCVLFITGGAIGEGPRTDEVQIANYIANLSGMYVAVLWQVPNQPLLGGQNEDGLITETLLKAIETKDASWPLLFPMAKSAVRAMDTVQELLSRYRNRNIKGFVVFGASKRGWTTWLTAATQDSRVVAIAPMVINTLNMQPQSEYQMANWGFYSEQIGDYSRRRLLSGQIDPNSSPEDLEFRDRLWRMIDPYFYRSRVTIPKLLIHGTNDRYWNLDATKFYWDDLVGAKYLLTLPNVGHNLGEERQKAMTTISAYARLVCSGGTLPAMTWKQETKGDAYTLSVTSNLPVKGAKLWVAYNEGRDFREAKWTSSDLQPLQGSRGNFLATIPKPPTGHIGFYIELETEYDGIPCSLTTEVFNP